MNTLVSMLRGVNVGGHRRMPMSELAELFASLGFADVRTYVQSGNVVFKHPQADITHIARQIERGLKSRLDLDVTVFIRTPEELERLVAHVPFAKTDPSKLHVTFLQSKPATIPTNEINAVAGEGERFSISDTEVYLFLPNGYGRSKLSNSFFERVLKVPATTRNWRTVTTLLDMAKKIWLPSKDDLTIFPVT